MTLRNKHQWNLYENVKFFYEETLQGKVVLTMATIFQAGISRNSYLPFIKSTEQQQLSQFMAHNMHANNVNDDTCKHL